jgi:hypothetical protein
MPDVPVAGLVEVFRVGSGVEVVATEGVELASSVVTSSPPWLSSREVVSSTTTSLLEALFGAID